MKKTLFALVLLFSVNALSAGESKDWKGWYDGLLKGLKTKVQSRLESKNRVSAVAAVRGAKQSSDPMALYWKGGVSDSAQKKLDAEKAQFAAAVELVIGGNIEEGRKALEKVLKDNPDSVFEPDVKEALSKLPPPQQAVPSAQQESPPAVAEKPAAKNPPAGEKKN